MGIFKRMINKKARNQPDYISDYYNLSSGLEENDGTAFACIDRIASQVAMLNYGIYDAKSKQKVKKHFLYPVLKQPSLDEYHFNFFYQSVKDYFNGGVFWLISRYEGETVSLFRLNPANVRIDRDSVSNRRVFYYNGKIYTSDDLVYIPSRFDYNNIKGGTSIFDAVKTVFDTSATVEDFTRNSFLNGVIGKRTVIDIEKAFPNGATAEQITQLKDNFQKEYSGVKNAGRPLIKKKGIEYSEFGSAGGDNQASELTENRKIQEHDECKVFGYPQNLLSPTANTNLENEFTLALTFAIQPLCYQFQEAINSLIDDDRYYFEFDFNGVLKVSLGARIDAYTKQINNGLLSPNEARAKENLPPIEAGDNYFMPVNLMPLNEETIAAYMAKQKNEMNKNNGSDDDKNTTETDDEQNGDGNGAEPDALSNPTDPNAQHFGGGDDKQ